jgi:hypothetical protein
MHAYTFLGGMTVVIAYWMHPDLYKNFASLLTQQISSFQFSHGGQDHSNGHGPSRADLGLVF